MDPQLPATAADAFWKGFDEYADYTANSFANPSFYNPLIYLFFVYIATFFLELVLPKRLNYSPVTRKGFWTDILYLIFIDFAFMLIGFYAVTSTIEYFTLKTLNHFGVHLPLVDLHHALPGWARFLVFFIVIDFLQWFAHFLEHRIGFLWQFHKVHHAQETLGFASTRHFHFGEYLVLKPAFWIPFGLLGFQASEYVIYYVWTGYFLTFLSHCNIRMNFGPLKYIFITPETHYWHHSRNIPGKYGVNYASSLVIWDLLFGHFYNPKDKKPILGIAENDVPDSFLGQMAYPFKRIFSRKKDVPQNQDENFGPKTGRKKTKP
jgi:sterol desaturase/sphingolipid hydroxylase (fatty acid hydroxylase superfamily)